MDDEENKKYIAELIAAGYKVQLNKDGSILWIEYWYPELIISKIDLSDKKDE